MSSFDAASITKYFRSLYATKVKDAISTYLVSEKISILEINVYLDELSQYMKEQIQPVMEEYGIELVTFYVNEISVPEDDTAVKKLKDALSKKLKWILLDIAISRNALLIHLKERLEILDLRQHHLWELALD